jgi:hypothetical protein
MWRPSRALVEHQPAELEPADLDPVKYEDDLRLLNQLRVTIAVLSTVLGVILLSLFVV